MTTCTNACFAPDLCAYLGYHVNGPDLQARWEADPNFFLRRPGDGRPARGQRWDRRDCVHHGEPMEPLDCCGKPATFTCALHGRATVAPNRAGVRSCLQCGDYTTAAGTVQPGDPAAGVVIGCYRWPRLAELQIRLIRYTCGPVPILLSDDCSPGCRAAFESLAARYPDVDYQTSSQRIGHAGGDLQAFARGIRWAADRGLQVLAKLSQRMLITRSRWLQDGATSLLASGKPLASQPCREGRTVLPVRTEACLLVVACWNRPELLGLMRPGAIGTATEARIGELAGGLHPWDVIGPDRLQASPQTLWHTCNSLADYQALARRHGVELDGDFTTAGWQGRPDYRVG